MKHTSFAVVVCLLTGCGDSDFETSAPSTPTGSRGSTTVNSTASAPSSTHLGAAGSASSRPTLSSPASSLQPGNTAYIWVLDQLSARVYDFAGPSVGDNVAVEMTSWVYAANTWQPTLRFAGNYVKSRKQLQLTSAGGYSEVWEITRASGTSMSLRSDRHGNVVWHSCSESNVWPSLVRASTQSCR